MAIVKPPQTLKLCRAILYTPSGQNHALTIVLETMSWPWHLAPTQPYPCVSCHMIRLPNCLRKRKTGLACASSMTQYSPSCKLYGIPGHVPQLLYLADNLRRSPQALYHLLALLPPLHRVVALLKQAIQFLCPVHLLQQLALHLLFRVSVDTTVSKALKSLLKSTEASLQARSFA